MERNAYIPQEVLLQNVQSLEEMAEQSREAEYSFESDVFQTRKVVQYELEFDRQQAREIREIQYTNPAEYAKRVENFKSFTEMQLVTALGERFNRSLSTYSYRNIDGVLYGEHSEEPFLDVLERGRAYREKFGNPVDHAREAAEVVGFAKIQETLANKETPIGTMMFSISQPGKDGSIYTHNFYDGFRKTETGDIEAVRFSSVLSAEETIDRLKVIDSEIRVPDTISDVSLLANPIVLNPTVVENMTLADIHAHLHESHEVMSEEEFATIRSMCAFLIVSYVNAVLQNPEDSEKHAYYYNAILNKADEIADALQENRGFDRTVTEMSEAQIYRLGGQPVRAVDTGCGFSGGADIGSALDPYSVSRFADLAPDVLGSRVFACPSCQKENIRPINMTLSNCQHCGSSEVACEAEDRNKKTNQKEEKEAA